MSSINLRLKAVESTIQEICKISGVAGLSYGVLHSGGIRSYGNFGFSDVANQTVPTEDTIYHIGSLTKFFTVATAGVLVEEGKLDWNKPVQEYIPEFKTLDDERTGKEITLLDLFSHRTGLASKLDIWQEGGNTLLLPKDQTVATCGYLEQVKPLRYQWQYNNWPFCLGGEVIEKITGKSYGTVLQEKIIDPLGLNKTIIDEKCSRADGIANAYVPLNNGTPFQVPRPQIQDGTIMAPAGGLRSTTSDLLTAYEAVMLTASDQSTADKKSPFKQLDTILSPHMPVSYSGLQEHTYALGWVRNQLPSPLGDTGLNGMFVDTMPVVNSGKPPQLVLSHHGSLIGFTSAAFIFPETATVVVVLANSLPLNDAVDWIAQALIETIFEPEHPNDYIALAKSSAEAHLNIYGSIEKELGESRIAGTTPRPLHEYVGRYYNKIGNMFLEFSLSNEELLLSFQGLESERYKLKHYHHDVFTWHFPRDEDVRRARWDFMGAAYYQFQFQAGKSNAIDRLVWAHEPDIPEGEHFMKGQAPSIKEQGNL